MHEAGVLRDMGRVHAEGGVRQHSVLRRVLGRVQGVLRRVLRRGSSIGWYSKKGF